jgi:hypothetical protein
MYLPEFFRLATSRAPHVEIADYLGKIEVERITMTTSFERRLDIARKAAALIEAWSMPVRS